MRWLRRLAWGLLLIIAALVAVAFAARLADGPIGPLAGGPLRGGELVSDPNPDWSFVDPIREIELQLVDPPRSRTVWVVLHDGQLYVPCGFLDVPFWKQWPHEAMRDGRAVLRIDDKRYERQAVRVTDPELVEALAAAVNEKYDLGAEGPLDPDSVWFFRLDPRT